MYVTHRYLRYETEGPQIYQQDEIFLVWRFGVQNSRNPACIWTREPQVPFVCVHQRWVVVPACRPWFWRQIRPPCSSRNRLFIREDMPAPAIGSRLFHFSNQVDDEDNVETYDGRENQRLLQPNASYSKLYAAFAFWFMTTNYNFLSDQTWSLCWL